MREEKIRKEENSSMDIKVMSIEVKKVVPQEKVVPVTGTRRRLVRFLFKPPPLRAIPPAWVAYELAGGGGFNRFAKRLAKSPPDLVTHLGMVRSNAYYDAGCPLELCDHAAARDLTMPRCVT